MGGEPQNPTSKWVYFDCPFCHHHKKKFAFNVETHSWKCWVCSAKGFNLFSLIRRLNKWHMKDRVQSVVETLSKKPKTKSTTDLISMPSEFIPLISNREFILKKRVLTYLTHRGITKYEIEKYNIGFCPTGVFQNRVIIPSYNESNDLNYFVARSINKQQGRKYLNPKCEKDKIIVFEHMINWRFPVILTQGIFDAIAVNFNGIPLLGKTISDTLIDKLLYYDADVYLSLDNDAISDQEKLLRKLSTHGVSNVYYVNLEEKDPSEMGRVAYWNYLLTNAKKYTNNTELEIMKTKAGKLFK